MTESLPVWALTSMAVTPEICATSSRTWLSQLLPKIAEQLGLGDKDRTGDGKDADKDGKDADKDFKKEFVPALRKVLAVYPQAKVQQVRGGVLLQGSPPPIPYKGGPTK